MSEHSLNLPSVVVKPNARSLRLPPYRGILAVDAKDFTGYQAVQHEEISRIIPQLLESSFSRADLDEVWNDRRFPSSTGDGYVFGFDPSLMPYVIHPWLMRLQEVLAEFNLNSLGTVNIRLRASLHIGPLPDTDDAFGGNGTPRNDTHRLLDSRPVKAMLASQSANVTQVAAILSDRCFQDVVVSGYTGRHEDYFIEVPATVEGKRFDQRAWLHAPALSGSLFGLGTTGDSSPGENESSQGHESEERPAEAGRTTVHRQSAARGNVNSGTVEGGQRVTNVERGGRYVDGDHVGGNKAGTVQGNQGDIVHGSKHVGGPGGDR